MLKNEAFDSVATAFACERKPSEEESGAGAEGVAERVSGAKRVSKRVWKASTGGLAVYGSTGGLAIGLSVLMQLLDNKTGGK